MILARFRDLESLKAAARQMRAHGAELVETYTPHEPSDAGPDAESSWVPWVILIAGVAGMFGFFLLQTYAFLWDYPMNLGGKPDFSWPAYIPNAFEVGILCAMVAGLAAFLAASGLPRLYAPVDRFHDIREATRDGYFLLVQTSDADRFRALLDSMQPLRLQDIA